MDPVRELSGICGTETGRTSCGVLMREREGVGKGEREDGREKGGRMGQGRKGERKGGREEGRGGEGGGERKGGREEGREGGKEGGREDGREEGRESRGEREGKKENECITEKLEKHFNSSRDSLDLAELVALQDGSVWNHSSILSNHLKIL